MWCGIFGLFAVLASGLSVCDRFGLWLFRFVAISIRAFLFCGRFDCDLSECGCYYLLPQVMHSVLFFFISRKFIFTRGQLWLSGIVVACVCLSVCVCVCVRQSQVCPRDYLSPVQASIAKFGPEGQNTLVKIPRVYGVHWAWHLRSIELKSQNLPYFELVSLSVS